MDYGAVVWGQPDAFVACRPARRRRRRLARQGTTRTQAELLGARLRTATSAPGTRLLTDADPGPRAGARRTSLGPLTGGGGTVLGRARRDPERLGPPHRRRAGNDRPLRRRRAGSAGEVVAVEAGADEPRGRRTRPCRRAAGRGSRWACRGRPGRPRRRRRRRRAPQPVVASAPQPTWRSRETTGPLLDQPRGCRRCGARAVRGAVAVPEADAASAGRPRSASRRRSCRRSQSSPLPG